jgi:hypothetical protein
MSEQKQCWGVGDQGDSKAFGTTVVDDVDVELIHGQFPHSRSDHSIYARWPNGDVEAFDGHRLLHEIKFVDRNYLKQSGLSGNEVRKGGECQILINGRICDTFFYRDVYEALINARHRLQKIHDFPIHLWDDDDVRRLVGRKVYYRDFPAIITRFIDDQACVILSPDHPDRAVFPPVPHEIEDGECDWGERQTVKEDIYSPNIWWWREK